MESSRSILIQGLADLGRQPRDGPAEQRMAAGKGGGIVHALEIDRGGDRLGELDELGQRPALRHAIPGEDRRALGRRQQLRRRLDRRLVAPEARRDAGRPSEIDIFLRIQDIRRDGKEDRARRRRQRGLGGAVDHARQIGEAAHLGRPFDEGPRDLRQLGPEDRLGEREALVMLARRHEERRAGLLGVVEHAHGIAQTRRHMDIDRGEAPGRLGIAPGHGHDRALLQPQHIARRGLDREGIHQRQLGGAGIAEDHLHALLAQQLQKGALAGHQRHGDSLTLRHRHQSSATGTV